MKDELKTNTSDGKITPDNDDFWSKDLPDYSLPNDHNGLYVETFAEALRTDMDSQFGNVLQGYREADSEKREMINRIFVHLCGYRLPSIVAKAHGFEPDEIARRKKPMNTKPTRSNSTTRSIRFVSGDLFINRYNAQALAHGCNCQGIMGAGVALGFKERHPHMYKEYRRRCKAKPRRFNLGDVFFWKVIGRPSVFNLGTQEFPGAHALYEAVEISLARMKLLAEKENIRSIAMPRIGAGYGGLAWEKVRKIIEHVFENWQGTLYVYEEFVPGEQVGTHGFDQELNRDEIT